MKSFKHLILGLVVSIILSSSPAFAGEIYKFKDAQGNWIFSDVPPSEAKELEKVALSQTHIELPDPEITSEQVDGKHLLKISNPYHAPLQIKIESKNGSFQPIEKVIPANQITVVQSSANKVVNYDFDWVIGKPDVQHKKKMYQVPIGSKLPYVISQGFNGEYSHFSAGARYAVDIAMEVGTYIVAARGGTVLWIKDDYHMSGTQAYFLDKANHVTILHDDGTYAIYAHTLLGSAAVKPGDKVQTGDVLARSGSSGFSTGPHLHFAILKNSGMQTESVIFEFDDNEGNGVIPTEGMKVAGAANVAGAGKDNVKDVREFEAVFTEAKNPVPVSPPVQETYLSKREQREQLDKACDQARYSWMVLNQVMPVYFDEERNLRALANSRHYVGEKDFLDEETRTQEKQQTAAALTEYCEDPDNEQEMQRVFDEWRRAELCEELRGDVAKAEELGTRFSSTALRDLREEADEMCSGHAPLPRFR